MFSCGEVSGFICYELTPVMGDEVLLLYIGGYLFLMFSLASLLSCIFGGTRMGGGSLVILALSMQARLR